MKYQEAKNLKTAIIAFAVSIPLYYGQLILMALVYAFPAAYMYNQSFTVLFNVPSITPLQCAFIYILIKIYFYKFG